MYKSIINYVYIYGKIEDHRQLLALSDHDCTAYITGVGSGGPGWLEPPKPGSQGAGPP